MSGKWGIKANREGKGSKRIIKIEGKVVYEWTFVRIA